MLGWLPGASERDIVDRELANGDLNDRGNDFADRSGSWNWQDSLGAWMAGSSKEKVLAAAQKVRDKKLNDAYGGQASTNTANLGPLSSTYTSATNKTESEMKSELATDGARAKALQVAIGDGELDVGTLSSNASVGAILGQNSKAKKAAAEATRLKLDGERKAEKASDRTYAEGLTTAANIRADRKEERMYAREDRKDERARLDRLENKRMEMELRGDEMKFKYAQLAQSDKMARQDRKDRAMMTLIRGLGNLGAAFTV